MIIAWLTAKGLFGLKKGFWLLGILVLLAVLWLVLGAVENADDNANQKIGQTIEREKNLTETIKSVEKANEAEAKISSSPDARRDGCLRHSRTPENC